MLFAIAALAIVSSEAFAAGAIGGKALEIVPGKSATLSTSTKALLQDNLVSSGARYNNLVQLDNDLNNYVKNNTSAQDVQRINEIAGIINRTENTLSSRADKTNPKNKERAAFMIAALIGGMVNGEPSSDIQNDAVVDFNKKFGTDLTVDQLRKAGCFPN